MPRPPSGRAPECAHHSRQLVLTYKICSTVQNNLVQGHPVLFFWYFFPILKMWFWLFFQMRLCIFGCIFHCVWMELKPIHCVYIYTYVEYWLISTIHNICKYVLVMERKSTILHLSPSSLRAVGYRCDKVPCYHPRKDGGSPDTSRPDLVKQSVTARKSPLCIVSRIHIDRICAI